LINSNSSGSSPSCFAVSTVVSMRFLSGAKLNKTFVGSLAQTDRLTNHHSLLKTIILLFFICI